ncbi:hypothetical protein Tco_0300216 [Tanacetum coccineum]
MMTDSDMNDLGIMRYFLVHNPAVPGLKLTKDKKGTEVDGTIYRKMVASEQDELSSSIGLDFRDRLDGGRMYSGYLEVNGSSCDGIDMVIKDLDLEPKVDAMMRDFL